MPLLHQEIVTSRVLLKHFKVYSLFMFISSYKEVVALQYAVSYMTILAKKDKIQQVQC